MGVGETMVWVVRHTLRTCLRGMALAATAVAGLPLLVVSLVCVLLLPAGLGVVLAPKSLLAVRRQAERQRRWAREWSGVTIAAPYRSRSSKPSNRLHAGVPALRVGSGRPRDLAGSALDAGQRAGQRGAGAAPGVHAGRLHVDRGGRLRDRGGRMGRCRAARVPAPGLPARHAPGLRHRRAVAAEGPRHRLVVAAGADQEGDGGPGGRADRVALGRGGRVGGGAAPDRARPARRGAGPAGRPRHEHRLRRADGQGEPGPGADAAGRGARIQRPGAVRAAGAGARHPPAGAGRTRPRRGRARARAQPAAPR